MKNIWCGKVARLIRVRVKSGRKQLPGKERPRRVWSHFLLNFREYRTPEVNQDTLVIPRQSVVNAPPFRSSQLSLYLAWPYLFTSFVTWNFHCHGERTKTLFEVNVRESLLCLRVTTTTRQCLFLLAYLYRSVNWNHYGASILEINFHGVYTKVTRLSIFISISRGEKYHNNYIGRLRKFWLRLVGK